MALLTEGFDRLDGTDREDDHLEAQLPSPGKVSLTSRLFAHAPSADESAEPAPMHLIADPGVPRIPFQADMQRAFGESFADVDVRLGGAGGGGDSARATYEGGRDVVAFDSTSPSREQVAHELTHVVQRRRFGEGTRGGSSNFDASEHEARDLAPAAAAGMPVTVRAAPAARVQWDAHDAENIHNKLHGFPFDDEPGALADLRASRDRANTMQIYLARYQIPLWRDFMDNASGDVLNQALALMWPHMTLIDKLSTRLGDWDDDETGILQTIQTASDTELRTARTHPQFAGFIGQLNAIDRFTARQRAWPERAVDNVGQFLSEGRGYVYDDEGPIATAIMNMTPDQRLTVWQRYESRVRAMFSATDASRIQAMCVGENGGPTTDDVAIERRMELATVGAGTDEDGVVAAVAAAGGRRDEAERIRVTLDNGRAPNGQPLTDSQRQSLNARLREIEGVDRLLRPTTGRGGRLDDTTFLGRAQDDTDAATVDMALTTARVDAFTRAKQALLMTMGDTGIDVDEEAALRILREVRGNADLQPGETLETVSAEELRRRRDADTLSIRQRLLRDEDLRPVWRALRFGSLTTEDADYAAALGAGDTYAAALYELEHAFEHVDTDEAQLLRIARDLSQADRERLLRENPPILQRIALYPWETRAFHRAFGETLRTGRIPADAGMDAAMGVWGDGTDEDLVTEILGSTSDAQRAQYRRGYLVHQLRARGESPPGRLSPSDQAALTAYQTLVTRLDDELTDEELDGAIETLLGLPSVEDMQSERGRMEAAQIMFMRQRQRLDLHAWGTEAVSTTDDTAAVAHVEFEARYNAAIADGVVDENEFAVLVNLDQQFNTRYREFTDTANMMVEIGGTVAAVVAAAVVIIASGGTATAATPGVVAWLSANSTLIAASAATSALAQVVTSEAMGGDFNEALDAEGARQALSGAINGALAVCGAALAEQAATMIGLSGRALTAQMARAAATATQRSVAGRYFARGVITGLIDGSLGGAVGDLAMTLTDAETWRRSVWDVLARAGASLLRGGLLGGAGGAATGGVMEMATGLLQARALRGVAVTIDDSMESSIHINFNINEETGAISNLAMRMGPRATDGDIAAHVERLAVIRRASEVLTEARRVASLSGHAEQEVSKLQQMINERLVQLRGPLSPQSRELIESELEVMSENLTEFRRVAESGDASLGSGHIGRPDAPPGYPAPPAGHYYRRRGDGWDLQLYPDMDEATPRFTLERNGTTRTGRPRWRIVAREGAAAEAVSFPEGTTRAQAFDLLTGTNSRSSFKQYWEMLERHGLATRSQVVNAMMDPAGRTEDAVRHALKEYFEPRVLQRCMRTPEGRALSEAESMAQLRLMTRDLNSSDRGNLTEAWYLNRHEGLNPHPTMTRDANPGIEGRGGRGVRNPDFLEGTELVELKATRSGLSAEEEVQINDDLLVCRNNGTVTIDGDLVQPVRSLRLVFANVEGARGSADTLTTWIRNNAFFSIEVYGRSGIPTRITRANLARLQREHGVSSLRELLEAL